MLALTLLFYLPRGVVSAVCVVGVGAMQEAPRPASVPAVPQADTKVSALRQEEPKASCSLEAPASRSGFLRTLSDISSVLII